MYRDTLITYIYIYIYIYLFFFFSLLCILTYWCKKVVYWIYFPFFSSLWSIYFFDSFSVYPSTSLSIFACDSFSLSILLSQLLMYILVYPSITTHLSNILLNLYLERGIHTLEIDSYLIYPVKFSPHISLPVSISIHSYKFIQEYPLYTNSITRTNSISPSNKIFYIHFLYR